MRKFVVASATLGVGILAAASAFAASPSGTADEAKALLARAVAAVKADEAGAMPKFNDPKGGFKERDLYVFCFDRKTGVERAGPLNTRDVRTLKDKNGKAFGQEMFDTAKDGQIVTVSYMFPRAGSTTPVAKESFVEGIGDVACGVGHYK